MDPRTANLMAVGAELLSRAVGQEPLAVDLLGVATHLRGHQRRLRLSEAMYR